MLEPINKRRGGDNNFERLLRIVEAYGSEMLADREGMGYVIHQSQQPENTPRHSQHKIWSKVSHSHKQKNDLVGGVQNTLLS